MKRVGKAVASRKYELAIFAMLILNGYLLKIKTGMGLAVWVQPFYALSYKYGFVSKALIGQITNIIFPRYIPMNGILVIVNLFTVLLCVAIAMFMGNLLKMAEKRNKKKEMYILVLLYLVSPGNVSTYFASGFSGRLEIFIAALVLFGVYLINKGLKTSASWFALAVICIVSNAIHHVFIFIAFPIILALVIYNLYESGFESKTMKYALLLCSVTCISFLYFQFFASIGIENVDVLVETLSERTDLIVGKTPLYIEYFASAAELTFGTMSRHMPELLIIFLINIILLSPLLGSFVFIWRKAMSYCSNKNEKTMLILMQLSGLLFVPAFVLTIDWGRWSVWYISFQFVIIFTLWAKQFSPILLAIQNFIDRVSKDYVVLGLVFLYLFNLNGVSELYLLNQGLVFYLVIVKMGKAILAYL